MVTLAWYSLRQLWESAAVTAAGAGQRLEWRRGRTLDKTHVSVVLPQPQPLSQWEMPSRRWCCLKWAREQGEPGRATQVQEGCLHPRMPQDPPDGACGGEKGSEGSGGPSPCLSASVFVTGEGEWAHNRKDKVQLLADPSGPSRRRQIY